jgi:peptide/nickel transport system permease protein
VLWGHALRNAMLPVITLLGLQFGALLGGAGDSRAWSFPGPAWDGCCWADGILRRDYAVVQGTVIFVAFFYVTADLAVDISLPFSSARV